MSRVAPSALVLFCIVIFSGMCWAEADAQNVPTETLEWQLVEAESALGQWELRIAESYYRGALRELWALRGRLAAGTGDLATAEQALLKAQAASAVDTDAIRVELAQIQLVQGQLDEPLKELRLLAHQQTDDPELLEIFIRGLIRAGKSDELAVELEQMTTVVDAGRAEALASLEPEQALLPMLAGFGLDQEGKPIQKPSADITNEILNKRLIATERRIERNLQILQKWTGFKADAPAIESYGSLQQIEAEPFGKVDLTDEVERKRVNPPVLDPVSTMTLFSDTFLGVFEALDTGETAIAVSRLEALMAEGDADALTLLGWIAASQGRASDAEQMLLKAVSSHPEPLLARQVLARLYWHSDREAAAKEQLLQAAELGALDRDLSLWLADLELADGRAPAANRQLRSLDRRFQSVEALIRLAEIFVGLNNPKLSMDYLEKARRLAPSSEEVLVLHTELALEIGVIPVAVISVEPLARMRPEEARYQLNLGRVWAGLRKMGESSEALLKALELDPELVEAFLPLGLALNHESRFELAANYLGRHLESFPEDVEAIAGMAEAEQRLGEMESAEARVRGILAQNPDHGRANLVLGLLALGRNELPRARSAFERAVAADPLSAKAHYQLSLVCARLRDRVCADQHLKLYKSALKGPESTFKTMDSKAVELTLQTEEEQP